MHEKYIRQTKIEVYPAIFVFLMKYDFYLKNYRNVVETDNFINTSPKKHRVIKFNKNQLEKKMC